MIATWCKPRSKQSDRKTTEQEWSFEITNECDAIPNDLGTKFTLWTRSRSPDSFSTGRAPETRGQWIPAGQWKGRRTARRRKQATMHGMLLGNPWVEMCSWKLGPESEEGLHRATENLETFGRGRKQMKAHALLVESTTTNHTNLNSFAVDRNYL